MPNFGASYVARPGRSQHQKDHTTMEHYLRVEIFVVTIAKEVQELNSRFNDQAMELLILSSTLDPKNPYKAFNIDKVALLWKNIIPWISMSKRRLI